MAEKDTYLDLGNNSRSRSNCECINTSNNGNIIITESERFPPDKKEWTSNIMNISKVSKTYAGNTASRSANSNSSGSNSHSVSVQSESMIGGVDLDLTHTLHTLNLDPDLEDGEQLEQSKRCCKSILHKETLDSHLSTQTHVMNTGQAESQSDPHLARKSLKGKHSLNSRFFKHIISGTSCVPSSSDLSMSIEADDDDIDNLSIDLNDDIVYTEADLKKAKVSNKASPNSSTLCWHCGSYASPTSSLSLSSSFEVDDDNFKSFDLPIFYFDSKDHLFPDWESDHSSTSSISHENMDDWADVDSMYDNLDDKFEEMRQKRSQDPPPLYPHRALLYLECSICLIKSYLRRRVCCDFQICHDCMSAYVSVKVNEAKVQIECPSDRCNVLVHRDEINERLPSEMRDKFAKFLIDANADPCEKTCPACSKGFSIKPETLAKKKKSKYGLKVTCGQCSLVWCFLCHAPYHTDITCKQYKKGNKMVKKWAKEQSCGQSNAQKCPKCGIYIQRVHGCDHMKCTKCHTDFCYQCGDRYISIKLLGNHWSRFSPLGCKYRLMPKRPGLRKFIRGTNFAARVVAGVILAGLGMAAGVVLVGASVVIVPGYGIFMLKQHLWRKKQLKRFKKQKMEMIARAERERLRLANIPPPLSSDQPMDIEPHIMEDLQQVKVMVHRSLSFSPEEAKDLSKDIIINKYTTDNAELSIARETGDDSIHLMNFSEVVEVKNPNGYSTIVCNIVSKLGENAATHSSDFNSELLGNEEACIKGINNLSLQSGETDMDTKVIHYKSVSVTAHEYEVTETESGYGEGHEDTKCDSYKKTLLEMTNSQEKINGCFSEYNEVNMSEVLVNDISDKDRGSIKDDSNGCFGNIFSKRIQNSVITNEDLFPKSQVPSFSRKFLSKKAATWEKCHCDKVKSLLKLNPQESKGDLNDSQSSTNNERTKQAMALLTGDETKNVISTNICLLDHSDISFRQRDSLLPNDSTIQQDISYSMEQISYPAKAPPCLSSTTVAPDSTFGVDQQLDVKPKLESHFEEENVSQHTLVTYL